MNRAVCSVALALLSTASLMLPSPQLPQGVFTEIFPNEEFAQRRAGVMAGIGDAVAILQGAPEKPAELAFRQNNQFFYLTGVEVPRAILVMDGRSKRSTLYLPVDERRARAQGPFLTPGDEAARITGIEAVVPREQLTAAVAEFGRQGRRFYTTLGAEVTGGGSRAEANALAGATGNDPWDGRPSRESAFIQRLKATADQPQMTIENLDPIIDRLRVVKSPREIAIIREASRISGLGIMEAMREAEPGVYEYELQAAAEYVFKKYGSQGPAYFGLVATGPNMVYSHYHRGTRRLADGDLVQFDYAPDYRYYVSDVTRVFPANGKFTPLQREFYTIYLKMYRALMSTIRPGAPVRDLLQEAGRAMESIVQNTRFTSPHIRAAALRFAERYKTSQGNSFGHSIGMEVHDVGAGRDPSGAPPVLRPGQLFTIEPAFQAPEERLAMRLEDALLVTETGFENLSAFVPLEIDDIEKLMAQKKSREFR